MKLRKIPAAFAVLASLAVASSSHAALSASATVALLDQPTSSTYHYGLSLHDTGSTPVATFWFSWIPGQDYMATSPTSIISPSGWSSTVTHGGPADGYAILFAAGAGSAVASGDTLSTFSFVSTSAPASFAGNSVFYPTTPVGTSFVYIAGAFGDPGLQIVVAPAPTPEPASACAALGLLATVTRRRR